jgi:hypothetical protein
MSPPWTGTSSSPSPVGQVTTALGNSPATVGNSLATNGGSLSNAATNADNTVTASADTVSSAATELGNVTAPQTKPTSASNSAVAMLDARGQSLGPTTN